MSSYQHAPPLLVTISNKIVIFAKIISMAIEELQEYYYSGSELPPTIQLMPGVKVKDVSKFS